MVKREDDTQIRLIRAEARDAVAEKTDSILEAVRQTGEEIKDEMHSHFATKANLADWKLEIYQDTDTKISQRLSDHVKRDHRVSLLPGAPTAKGRVSNRQIAGLVAALGTLAGAVYALAQAL